MPHPPRNHRTEVEEAPVVTTPLWITATPPATDSELHVGQLAGPYVAADVLRRFLRADGRDVLFTTGTADHSSSVELRALRSGRKPEEVAEGYRAAVTADWLRCGIVFDRIVEQRVDRSYQTWLRSLFLDLYAQGVLVPRTRLLPHCAGCDRWLYGAHVKGTCPQCDTPAEGGVCRSCARPNDCGDLVDPVCTLCGTAARPRRCRRLYLALEPFRERLADHWLAGDLPPRLAVLCESLIEDGLPDVAVGHPGEWGVLVPVEGFEQHRIDSCFEAAALHLYAYGYDSEPLPNRSVHFCGVGHSFCTTVLLPAILMAQGRKLAQEFFVNETFRIRPPDRADGTEVWALDLLTEFGSDTLRRHVLEDRPLGRGTRFDRDRLVGTRSLLDGTWNSWLGRLFATVREDCAGRVPEAEPGGSGWPAHRHRLIRAVEDLREAYSPDTYDPRRAVAVLDEVVRSTADFGHVNAHERRRPNSDERHLGALNAQLAVASALTAWAAPVMPEGARRLAAALHVAPDGPVTAEPLAGPTPGARLAPPSGPVFGF